MDSEAGQATVELVAAIPALLLAGLLALQLLATGYALTLADGAAEAGALALAAGRPAKSAVREALPDWADDSDVSVRGGEVTVRLRPPSLLSSLADRLAVTSSAFAEMPRHERDGDPRHCRRLGGWLEGRGRGARLRRLRAGPAGPVDRRRR